MVKVLRRVRDISHWNNIGNYAAFKADTHEVQVKVSESTGFIDSAGSLHYRGCGGIPRAPYHFAQPVNLASQIAHFIRQKNRIGRWERMDMLDCEFKGITGAFIRAIVAEYRRQTGIRQLQVYVGFYDITHACPPSLWWDEDISMQVARYRKIGAPTNTDAWGNHLGFDHIGLDTYQWDNDTPFYPGSTTRGDISFDRILMSSRTSTGDDMPTAKELWEEPIQDPHSDNKGWAKDVLWETNLAAGRLAGAVAEQRTMLAQVIANQQDDLSADDVLDRLDTTFRDALNESIIPALRAAAIEVLREEREATPDEVAEAVVSKFQARLVS